MPRSPFKKNAKTKQEIEREKQDKEYYGHYAEREGGQFHSIGYTRAISFNSLTERVWPSDYPFIMFTLSGILIPAGCCIWITIAQADSNIVDDNTKIGLIGFYVLSVFISLYCLFQVSTTEPGILPSVYMNSGIPPTEKHIVDSIKDYYCEYNSKNEIAQTMEELGIENPAHKFYHLHKFSYV